MGTAVTAENFIRAETDTYFTSFVEAGAFGSFIHSRELADVHHQSVVRMNRDTLYSWGVFDLDAGPVTVTLPETRGRFMSLLLINEDHYNPDTIYAPGRHVITRDQIGTRYAALLIRTFVNPDDAADVKAVHVLQDAVRIEQPATGSFKVPDWDTASLTSVREELKARNAMDFSNAFGKPGEVDPEQHLIATAMGWGGNPARDAFYVGGSPASNDGTRVHHLSVKDVPVDGFWSISVYDKDGFFAPNPQNAYSLNNITAQPDTDGSYTIQFGGDPAQPNVLPITPDWNYTVRLYRPRQAILDHSWKFPEPEPVK